MLHKQSCMQSCTVCVCVCACVRALRVCVTCKPIMCMYALAHNTCIHTYIASMRAIHAHHTNYYPQYCYFAGGNSGYNAPGSPSRI